VILRYDAGEDTYEVATNLVVRRGGKVFAKQTHPLTSLTPGQSYSFKWRAPKTGGTYTFCVTVTNRQGTTSAPSCAPIDLR
jgi:hypothetical protein